VAKRSGVEAADDLDYITHYQHSRLGELGYMSNIDKHRRLALTAWRSTWCGGDLTACRIGNGYLATKV